VTSTVDIRAAPSGDAEWAEALRRRVRLNVDRMDRMDRMDRVDRDVHFEKRIVLRSHFDAFFSRPQHSKLKIIEFLVRMQNG
jgi:hypothetical protein